MKKTKAEAFLDEIAAVCRKHKLTLQQIHIDGELGIYDLNDDSDLADILCADVKSKYAEEPTKDGA